MNNLDKLIEELVTSMPNIQLILEKCDDDKLLGQASQHILIKAMKREVDPLLAMVTDDLIIIRQREIRRGKVNRKEPNNI